ncbi:MAG: DUF2336 domain-containing protein [Pseudolabrys sp.]
MSKAQRTSEAEGLADSASLIDELLKTPAKGNAERRAQILLRIADLFRAGSRRYTSEQIALFDDVLQELTADIEIKTRARLSHTLAGIENAPPKTVRTLAFDDEIAVAGPVLVHSLQLTDADLVENATSKSQEHLLAIAQRLSVSEAVTDVLVRRGDRRVVHKIVENTGARFSLAGHEMLTIRAYNDHKLTLALGRRSDIPRQFFLKLLENASASVRARLEAANPEAVDAVRDALDAVTATVRQEVREASQEHATAVRETERRARVEPLTEASVHAPARAQEFEKTALALSRLGGFPLDQVERALLDEGGDMVLLFAKAAGCTWTTTRELLTMYAANRGLSAEDLARALARYRKLSQKTAISIVAFQGRKPGKRRSAGKAAARVLPPQAAMAQAI